MAHRHAKSPRKEPCTCEFFWQPWPIPPEVHPARPHELDTDRARQKGHHPTGIEPGEGQDKACTDRPALIGPWTPDWQA